MSATKYLFTRRAKVSIEEIVEREKSLVSGYPTIIMVIKMITGYEQKIRTLFVSGSGSKLDSDGKPGDRYQFTQDTGHGHGMTGQIEIENAFLIVDGKITEQYNDIGLDSKRPLWVFK